MVEDDNAASTRAAETIVEFGAPAVSRVAGLISASIRGALDRPLNYARSYLASTLPGCIRRVVYLDSDVVLTDGGVYDNLGLETAYKRCRTLLVSDAGQPLSSERDPHEDWARHAMRVEPSVALRCE
jgi:hypothetical protein